MANIRNENTVSSSFRDPSGFVYIKNGELFRQINLIYKDNYDCLMQSGLYKKLADENLLIPHVEVICKDNSDNNWYKTIKPEPIKFISYPYEWCFSQLKNAALLTLRIQKIALEFNMSLKDASAYNIQFLEGSPIFIDTLSFEQYKEGLPWVAYRQFCQHFLAPLALMACCDIRSNKILSNFIDGLPLDMASSLLPVSSFFNISLLTHLHFHAKSQKYYSDKVPKKAGVNKISKTMLLGIIASLESAVNGLKLKINRTEWGDYYENTNYTETSFEDKKHIVNEYLDILKPSCLWDLAANNGEFSKIAGDKGINTVCFDIDHSAVEQCYKNIVNEKYKSMLPLIIDLTNPSPNLGWENTERTSLINRGPVEMAMALALVHHLAISNNLPFDKIASFFAKTANSLIIEFVPKDDSQVQKLLATREDIFVDYTKDKFEESFNKYFKLVKETPVKESGRVLYLYSLK